MKTKHTQGPLKATQTSIEDANGVIATTFVNTSKRYIGNEEAYANAQLFAAAPELLEALQYILNCNTKDRFKCELQDAINKAEAAIKKAKGE